MKDTKLCRSRLAKSLAKHLVVLLACLAPLATLACGWIDDQSQGRAIVYVKDKDGNKDLYEVRLSNPGAEKNLTRTSDSNESAPRVSPNGKLIAFQVKSSGQIGVDVIKRDSQEPERHKVTTVPGIRFSAASSQRWSPDSNRIAYVAKNNAETLAYVVNKDGETNRIRLTTLPVDDVGGWSKDGKNIVFAVHSGKDKGVYIRNPDGVDQIRVTEEYDISPVWSPDSTKIAFISHRNGPPDIYVANKDRTGLWEHPSKITNDNAPEYGISWSPDSSLLLFVSEKDGNPEVYTFNVESREIKRLTHNNQEDTQPVWSPNGNMIAFVSYPDGDSPKGHAEIFYMSKDGSAQTRLTNNAHDDTSPSW